MAVACPDCGSTDIGHYKYSERNEPDHACRDCGIKFDHGGAHHVPKRTDKKH